MTIEFYDHVNELYDFYKPDLNSLPTPDEILSGTKFPQGSLSFDQQFELTNQITNELIDIFKKYNYKSNILIDSKIEKYLKYLEIIQVEIQIFFINKLTSIGMNIQFNK